MNFTSYTAVPLISSYLPSALATSPQEQKKNLGLKAVLCHSVFHSIPVVHTSFLANIHHNESFVWYEASGFYCTINIGTSLGLLSDAVILSHWQPSSFGYVGLAPSWTDAVDGLNVGLGQFKDAGYRLERDLS